MSKKTGEKIVNVIARIIVFFIFAGVTFVAFAVIYALFGVLKKDGAASDIAAILAVVVSAGVGIVAATVKTADKTAAQGGKSKEDAEQQAPVEEPAPAEEAPDQVEAPEQAEEQPATDRPAGTVKTYRVAGVTRYEKNILHFATKNPEYSLSKRALTENTIMPYDRERIWKYDFFTPKAIELVPEPDNAYDSNAIKVMVDGVHVGYIKSGSCKHLLKCIQENRIAGITCRMGGGPYKLLEKDEDDFGEESYDLTPGNINLYVHLSITELPASD